MRLVVLAIVALTAALPALAQEAVTPQAQMDAVVASLKGRGYTDVTTRMTDGILTITAVGAGGEEHFRLDPQTGDLVPTDEDGILEGTAPAEDAPKDTAEVPPETAPKP